VGWGIRNRTQQNKSNPRLTLCAYCELAASLLVASRIMSMRSLDLATAMTCLPRPLPSDAPSMIPGRSSSCIFASL
jgi:hypothetical protein